MAMIPHPCNRDCERALNGLCTFFNGDLYYLMCIDNATMYKPRHRADTSSVNLKQ